MMMLFLHNRILNGAKPFSCAYSMQPRHTNASGKLSEKLHGTITYAIHLCFFPSLCWFHSYWYQTLSHDYDLQVDMGISNQVKTMALGRII